MGRRRQFGIRPGNSAYSQRGSRATLPTTFRVNKFGAECAWEGMVVHNVMCNACGGARRVWLKQSRRWKVGRTRGNNNPTRYEDRSNNLCVAFVALTLVSEIDARFLLWMPGGEPTPGREHTNIKEKPEHQGTTPKNPRKRPCDDQRSKLPRFKIST